MQWSVLVYHSSDWMKWFGWSCRNCTKHNWNLHWLTIAWSCSTIGQYMTGWVSGLYNSTHTVVSIIQHCTMVEWNTSYIYSDRSSDSVHNIVRKRKYPHTRCIFAHTHTRCIFTHTTYARCIFAHTRCIFAHTYIHTLNVYSHTYTHTLDVYSHTHTLDVYSHTLDLYSHTLDVYSHTLD